MKGRVNAGVACKEMVFDKGPEGDVLLEQDAFAAGIKRHSARPRLRTHANLNAAVKVLSAASLRT